MRLLTLSLLVTYYAAAQTGTAIDWGSQVKNKNSYPVTQNTAGTNGGYIQLSPVTYSPYDGSICMDKWGNQVQQPLPTAGQTFGPNDLIIWNSLSPSLPYTSPQAGLITGTVQDVLITSVPSTGPGPCGPPLPVNQLYGINTNGYFFGRAGLATDSPVYNSIQSLQGGITANSITMGVLYPIGTVTTTGTLVAAAYLGGHMDTGHSVGPPTCTGGYPCATSDHVISGSTNPLSAGEGLVAGMIYYDDGLKCEQVYSGTAWGCMGGGGGGTDPTFHSVTASTVFNSAADVNGGNAFQTSMGNVHITGAGDAFFQSDNVTNAFNSLADVSVIGNVATLGTAVTWLSGTHFIASMAGANITINKVLYQVATYIDNSHLTLASSAGTQSTAPYQFGNAVQTSTGTLQLTGSGFLLGQAFVSHGPFNSQADVFGGNAFQTSGGTMSITGAGVANFQSLNLTNGWTAGNGANLTGAGILTVSGCIGCGGGGGGPAGPPASIQFNGNPGFSGDANLSWAGSTHTLQILGSAGQGVTAPVFSASAGRTTQTNVEFQGTNFSVLGNGTVQFNGPLNFGGLGTAPALSATGNATIYYNTVNNDFEASYSTTAYTGLKSPVFNCTATGAANCVQSSPGTFTITGAGNAAFQSVALTNGWTSGGGASLSAGGALVVSSCTGCGGGGGGSVSSFNGRVGAVTLTKNDVTSVTQALAATDSPQFVGLTLTGSIAVGNLINGVTYQNQNGTFTVASGGGLAAQSIAVGSGSPLTISNTGVIITTGAATIGTTFNVGSHGSSTASSGGGAAISNSTNNIALLTYDTGGVCGIGSGEPSPGIACSSDERLKKNISSLPSSLSEIMSLRPVSYDWKTNGTHGIGFIAQEVQKVLPELVTEQDGYLMLSADGMIPYLVKAIQEQQVEIEALKSGRSLTLTVAKVKVQ